MPNCQLTQAITACLRSLEGQWHGPGILKLFWKGSVL